MGVESGAGGTVVCVDTELAQQLAEASSLPDRVQLVLWEQGDLRMRTRLARRHDLVDQLGWECLTEPELVEALVSAPRIDSAMLERCAELVGNETAMIQLAGQQALSGAGIRLLAARASAMTCWTLLAHPNLPHDLRAELARRYVTEYTMVGKGAGHGHLERIGNDTAVWVEVLDACCWQQLGVLHYAWLRHGQDPTVVEAAVRALERIDRCQPDLSLLLKRGREPIQLEALDSTLFHIVGEMLTTTVFSTDQLDRLDALSFVHRLTHPRLAPLSALIREQYLHATAQLQSRLTCTLDDVCDDDHAREHVAILSQLYQLDRRYRLPVSQLAIEALQHKDLLDGARRASFLDVLVGRGSRDIVAELAARSRFDDIAMVVEAVNMTAIDNLDEVSRVEVVGRLAQRGYRGLRGHKLSDVELHTAALQFRPACSLLQMPELLGAAVSVIEDQAERQRDTVYALLSGWHASLDMLIETAQHLDGDKPQ